MSAEDSRFGGARLEIYRKVHRSMLGPAPADVPIPALGRSTR